MNEKPNTDPTLDYATIREGAMVWMDMRPWKWPELPHAVPNMAFRIEPNRGDPTTVRLRANHFGLHKPGGEYGSGALTVNREDLIHPGEHGIMKQNPSTMKNKESPVRPTGPSHRGWAYSLDQESYTGPYPTKEKAIAEGRAVSPPHPPHRLWVGRCVDPPQPHGLWSAEDWINHVACQEEYSMDCAEAYLRDLDRADKAVLEMEVRAVMKAWLDRNNLQPDFFMVEDAEEIQPEDVAPVRHTGEEDPMELLERQNDIDPRALSIAEVKRLCEEALDHGTPWPTFCQLVRERLKLEGAMNFDESEKRE